MKTIPASRGTCYLFNKLLLGILSIFIVISFYGLKDKAAGAEPVDVSAQVSVSYSTVTTSYNFLTKVYTATHTVTLTNSSTQPLSGPLHGVLVFNSLIGTVTVPGALGGPEISPYSLYYFDLADRLTDGVFHPGASVSFKVIIQRKLGTTYSSTVIKPYAVLPPNQPPHANAGQPQVITLLSGQTSAAVILDGRGTDPDGSVVSFAWSGIPDPEDVAQPTVSLVSGTYTFTLTVTDDKGAVSAPSDVVVTVNPPANRPPLVTPVVPVSGIEGVSISFTVTVSDPDDDPIVISASGLPAGSSFDPGTGTFSWTPGFDQAGTYQVTFTASDGSLTASLPVTISVVDVNMAPVITTESLPAARAGQPYLAQVWASDPDRDPLTFTLPTAPAGMTIASSSTHIFTSTAAGGNWSDPGTWIGGIVPSATDTVVIASGAAVTVDAISKDASGIISWTPGVNDVGSHSVEVAVDDGKVGNNTRELTLVVTIPPPNEPPVAIAGDNRTIQLLPGEQTATVTLSGSGTDVDGTVVSYAWGGTPKPADVAAPTVTLAPGTYNFDLVVTDNQGATSAPSRVTVQVLRPENRPPQLNAIGAKTVAEGQKLEFSVTGTDPDNDQLTAAAKPLPAGALIDPVTGLFSWTPGFTHAGTYQIAFSLSDGTGPTALATQEIVSITVTDVNQKPIIVTQSLPAPKIDYPYAPAVVATDPDDDTIAFAIGAGAPSGMTIDPATGLINWRPGAGEIGKSYTFEVTASDGKGETDTRQYTVAIADTVPPAVVLNVPKEAIPGSSFTATASATDNVGVTELKIVAGSQEQTCSAAMCEMSVTLPEVQAIGTSIAVVATARDAAGNSSETTNTVTTAAVPDTVKPSVTLSAPREVKAGTTVTLSALAADYQGIERLEFTADGAAAGRAIPPDFGVSYVVPAATVGQKIVFGVTVYDFSGNETSATAESTIVEESDEQAPTITMSVPPVVQPGAKLPVTLKVTDDRGVAMVEIYLAHQKAATFASALDQVVELPLPAGAEPGMQLVVEVRAVDAVGNPATASAESVVAVPGQGVITGAVYDDTTGLPLLGATVKVAATGKPLLETLTDRSGRYSMTADEGVYSVSAAKGGYTSSARPDIVVAVQAGVRVPDARLTPLGSESPVSAMLGGTVSAPFSAAAAGFSSALNAADSPATGTLNVSFPTGAFPADRAVAVTQVGAQGLQGRLPYGWSPVAAVDMAPHGITLAIAGSVSMPNLFGSSLPSPAVVAMWQEETGSWLSLGSPIVSADGATLTFELPATAQYAVIVPDAATQALPPAGAKVEPVATAAVPEAVQATVTPQPKLILYKPGAKSLVGTRIVADAPLASGTVVWANIAEDYRFYSGERMTSEPYFQEIVLYSYGQTGTITADYYISAGEDFAGLTLEKGVITVTAAVPPPGSGSVGVVGFAGGTIFGPGGESLVFPTGALAGFVPVTVMTFSLPDSGLSIPAGFRLVGGVTFSLAGQMLTKPAILSVPVPADFVAGGDLLVVTPVETGGATRFAIIGAASAEADAITSTITIPGTVTARFPGIRNEGRVLVLQAAQALGYAGGTVAGTGGEAFSGAVVSGGRLPFIAFSGDNGFYATAVMPGAIEMTAQDPVKLDKGTAGGTAAAQVYLPLDLSLRIEPPKVVGIVPAAGAPNVPLADPVKITLSEPVVVSSVTLDNIRIADAGGVAMTGSVELSADGMTATFRHGEPFASNTPYTVSVNGLVDRSGTAMDAAGFTSTFTALNTSPPPAPPAGSVTASVPGTNGQTIVTGTQGTAGLHDTVVIVNLTTGERNPVLVETNGGFTTTVKASVTDQLQLELTGTSGATTTVQLPRFRQVNGDGSVSEVVGTDGGIVQGPAGIELTVAAGTFAEPAVVTVKPVAEADFPVQLTEEARQVYSFTTGVELDFGGATPAKYIDVSIPPQGSETRLDQWVVAQVAYDEGLPTLNVVDTAHYFGDRIATSSPPCPGVTGSGIYGVLRSHKPVGIAYGQFINAVYGGIAAQIQSVSDFVMVLPTLAANYNSAVNSQMFCLPILSGRVNVIPNSHTLTIRSQDLNANDREIVVKNSTLNSEQRFPRNILEMTFEMDGKGTDLFEVELEGGSGSSAPFRFFKVYETTAPGKVSIRFSLEKYGDKLTQVKITNKSKDPVVEKTFPITDVPVSFTVEGSVSDSMTVAVVNYDGVQRSFTDFTRTPLTTASGNGNLVLRAQTGTIDPTQTEIDAYNADHPTAPITGEAVTELYLEDNKSPRTVIPIPLTELKQGGLAVSFDGDRTAQYFLRVKYADGKEDGVVIPQFRIIVKNPQTGKVIRTIEDQSPLRGEPLSLGIIGNASSNDPPRLTMIPSRFKDYDPSVPVSFTFSQEVDQATAKTGFTVTMFNETGGTETVTGTLSFSNGGKTVTFIPDNNLKLGTRYKIELKGIKNKTGKVMPDELFYLVTLKPKRICPPTGPADCEKTISIGNDGRNLESLYDVAFTRKRIAGQLKTTVFATGSDQAGYRLLTFDVTDPQAPSEIGHAYGGYYKRKLSLLEGVTFDIREAPATSLCGIAAGTTKFTGDLVAVNSSNLQSGYVSFFDVTDPYNPCVFGNKLLTANPDNVSSYDQQGTIKTQANAGGIATIRHSTGVAAYAAFTGAGIMAMDIGKNIPEYNPGFRVKEGLFSGDFLDIITYRDTLLGVDSSNNTLYRLDPNLTPMASLSLGDYSPRRVVAAEVVYDKNNNRLFEPDEFMDVAFVAGNDLRFGTGAVTKVNISDQSTLTPFSGIITMPGIIRELEYDKTGKRLFVGSLNTLYLLDVSNPDRAGTVTNTLTQSSPLMWKADFPTTIRGIKFDADRGLAYIGVEKPYSGQPGGLDIWSFNGVCSDLSVQMTRKNEELRPKAELLEMEREALRKGITAAMKKMQAAVSDGGCGISGAPFSHGITILEQGSGACIWKKGDTCRNFQPQISDHDFEVFVPSSLWSNSSCIANVLKDQFIDKNTDLPVKFELTNGSVEFDDITFFAFPKEEFESAKPNVKSPAPAGSDAIGDAGLGRRQLLLKWVLEGAYVTPGTTEMEPGPDGVRGTPDDINPLAGKSLKEVKNQLVLNKIPLLEGYEQSLLQQFNLVKSKAFVRLIGASSPESVLHTTFQKQLHDAAKAGIRSALGRLVSVSADNSAVLAVTRDEFESNACIEDPAKPEAEWKYGPCDSFEHFIASVAVRRKPALFTTSELADVAKFYRIKSDLETITSETEANNFILKSHAFIEQSATSTLPVYSSSISDDPDAVERQKNVTTIGNESTGLLADKLKGAKIQVVPNFNNQGFMEGTDLKITMYEGTTAGAGTMKTSITATLSGGDYRSADYVRNTYFNGQIVLTSGAKQPVFQVGPVDMTDTSAQHQGITFTIDLPTTGYQKVMKETYLQNNYDGFYYYVLPRNASPGSFTPPSVTGKPPLPLPDPSGNLLKADPFCQDGVSDLEFYMTANGNKQVTVGVDKEVTLGYRVRNVSTKTIKNIKVVRNGATVMSVASLAPGDEQMNSESFTPTDAKQYNLFASAMGEVQNSSGAPEYSAGPKISSVEINANDLNEPFKIKFYDASKLNDNAHSLSRWLLMHDSSANDKEIVGAVTDGDDTGGGARIRIEIEGLNTGKSATVTLQDGDLDNVTDGVGTIYSGAFVKNQYSVTVTPDILGKATVYFTPPGFFERNAYKKEDTGWPASYSKVERSVRVRVKQADVGRSTRQIKLRRPPVMLVHGLWGNRTVWKDFQPLVPASGVGDYYKPVKGFDGRFDVFAVGTPSASESYEALSSQLVSEFKYAISDYLPGFSIGKFDVVAHSLGGVLARRITSRESEFPGIKDSVRKLISNASPFKGSEIANELVAIRAKNILKRPEFQDLGKAIDFANPHITVANKPSLSPDELAKAAIDFCSLAINALGFANAYNTSRGALDDLQTTSMESQLTSFKVPTHTITGTTMGPPIVEGTSLEVQAAWTALTSLCKLTADEDTKALAAWKKSRNEIIKALLTFGRGAVLSSAYKVGNNAKRALNKASLELLENLGKSEFEQVMDEQPKAVFGTAPNDRIVKTDSQMGGLSRSGYAYTDVYGKTDHQQLKIAPGAIWQSCVGVDTALNIPILKNTGISPGDINGDGSPDVGCRVVELLEADPSGRLFTRRP